MCYYIGIEDLAANALIEMLTKQPKRRKNFNYISLRKLEDYGREVVAYIDKNTNEKAFLILSRASTNYMFQAYSNFFKEVENDGNISVALRDGKRVNDLRKKFRTYISIDLINAFQAEAPVNVLFYLEKNVK